MHTTSKQQSSANDEKPVKVQIASDIPVILQEADRALLAGKPVVTHSCLRLAITELMATL